MSELSDDEITEYLMACDSYERTDRLALVLIRVKDARRCLSIFLKWGCVCDAPWPCRSVFADMLRRARDELELSGVLGPEAAAFYAALPESVAIWRGCQRGRERGLHWTTDRAVAEGFAAGRRFINPSPTLVSAEIPKRHIFAVFVDRQESEIVVDWRRLRKLKAEPFAAPPLVWV